jgi:hypothetical protein
MIDIAMRRLHQKRSDIQGFLFMVLVKHMAQIDITRFIARTLGDRAHYVQWLIDTFHTKPELSIKRETVWSKMISQVARDRPVVVWEFGVRAGYATDWWLKRLTQKDLKWHGFDRFTGLPRDWRNYKAGDMSAGGTPPVIDDARVRWYIGNVEDTLPKLDIRRDPTVQWIVLFDLDLYEPTSLAWKCLQPHLRAGDLLYFDEAFDDDERRVLNESVIGNSKMLFSVVGCTPIALALRVEAVS